MASRLLTDKEMFDSQEATGVLTDSEMAQLDNEEFEAISNYIRANEGTEQEVYDDTSGNKTVGVGHLLKKGEVVTDIEGTFKKDVREKIGVAKGLFPSYKEYPIEVKQSLVDGTFRGEHEAGYKTTGYINKGRWGKVPDEYINRDDYRASKASEGTETPITGVYKRMDRNAEVFRNYADKDATRPQSTANSGIAGELAQALTDEQMFTPEPNKLIEAIKRPVTPYGVVDTAFEAFAPEPLKKLKQHVLTSVIAPTLEIAELAEQIGVPLAKGEGVMGIDILGKDRSILEFPKAKEILGDMSKLGAKIASAVIPGLQAIQEPIAKGIEALPKKPFEEAGRFGLKLATAAGLRKGAIEIAKYDRNVSMDTIYNYWKDRAISKGVSPERAETIGKLATNFTARGQMVAPDELLTKLKFRHAKLLQGEMGGIRKFPKDTKALQLAREAKKFKSAEEFVNFMRGSATQYRDYSPQLRAKYKIFGDSARISELGIDPEREVTIYRGVPDVKTQNINDGDFVTVDKLSAESYVGKENVVSKKVKAKDLIADSASEFDKDRPFELGAEFIYSDSKNKLSFLSDSQLTNIWEQAQTPTGPKAGGNVPIQHRTYSGLVKTMQSRAPGIGLDDIAMTLTEEGKLKVPEERNPGDYLNELVKTGAVIPTDRVTLKAQKDFEKELRAKVKEDSDVSFDPEEFEAEIQKDLDKFRQGIIKDVRQAESPKLTKGKVKPSIHKATGLRKSIDTIVTNEMAILKDRLKAQAVGARGGERAGKAEIRSQEALKRRVTGLVSSLKSMGDRKLPVEYKDQVDSILEQYDLKARMDVTREKRASITEFVDVMREQGDLAFVPRDYFKDYGQKTTLDEMSLEDLENLHNQVKVLVTAGSNEGKLISFAKELDLENTVDTLAKTIYQRGKMAEPTEEELRYRPPSARKKGIIKKKLDATSKYFSGHRKIENLTRILRIWDKIWQPLQGASDTELIKGGEMSAKFKQIFAPIAKNSVKMVTETIPVKGLKDPITRWEAIGVALNSENAGNVQRLIQGNQYTEEQIKAIKKSLTPTETKFIDDVFKMIDSYWIDTETNIIKAVGVRPKKVTGKYFPIKTDYSQDIEAQMRESQKDVMKDIFSKAFLEKGFTKSRVGGRGPIDLDVLPVILKHTRDVIHYNAFVLPMRDVQKIIHHPKFKKAIVDVMGEATYSEFKPWLADTVNPKTLSPQNIFEAWASALKKNSTASILGYKMSVSLLQGGSFLQTVHKIGLKSAMGGIADFYKNPIKAVEWVYSKSPEIKYRSTLWDRELKDWLDSAHAKKMLKGMPGDTKSTLFAMIRGVDFLTVMPSWMGAYNRELSISGDESKAISEADSLVRRTQPMGSVKDLPRMLRGRPFQKFFTMFKSFYTTMHNMLVDIKDEYRFSDDPFISKTGKAATGYFWVWVVPALLATWIRSGFKEREIKKYAKGVLTFPLQGMFLISDLVNSIASGFGVGTPALKAFLELSYGAKGKKPYTKIKHFAKAIGAFAGQPVDALWTFGEGAADLYQGKTSDPRRLVYSKYALGEKGKKTESIGVNKKEWLKQFRKKIHGNKGNKEEWLKQFREKIGR